MGIIKINEKTFRDLGSGLKGRSVSPVPLTKYHETRGGIHERMIP